ncbi:Rrf2 family transcriptional regulator [Fusibacter paucivorans]|uniref:Rrf2 family transcriptional regulator n=1 Tax=Fusibacter paucivorans TaxID=76009 RepID=A0ABS5PR77_9FIRM|nr:Rrf2 family transcriptional regulator [Fusibacter paucivorans]MBS7527576.1 Rrf2 family transcriptional regulator [Fusibacter paucivorans]
MQIVTQSGDLGPKWFHVALRAMALMAESDTILKSNYIAGLLGEDPTAVRKILAKLMKAKLVRSFGGRYGGYSITKSPAKITVLSVYQAFETQSTSYDSVPSTGTELFISLVISKAENEFQAILQEFTLQDIIENKSDLLNRDSIQNTESD